MLRQILRGTLRWTLAWALLGLILGLFLMVTKSTPIAESGRKPDNLMFYVFWVPFGAGFGALWGCGLGFLFQALRAVTGWPRVLCGTIAGAITGVIFSHTGTTFVFLGAVGLISGALSGFIGRLRPDGGIDARQDLLSRNPR